MGIVKLDMSISLDGFVAGPRPTLDAPLGEGGGDLHAWAFATATFRAQHGLEGGETGVDDDVVAEGLRSVAATVMGRRMFSGGSGPWETDPNAASWFGDDPPFHHPVFVLTTHAREAEERAGGTTFTFVTDGIASALAQARAAAGDGVVQIGGGASVAQQMIDGGLLDELHLHVVPVLLGGGTRLFDGQSAALEPIRSIASPSGVTHLSFRVA